jgi:hypothetical protein
MPFSSINLFASAHVIPHILACHAPYESSLALAYKQLTQAPPNISGLQHKNGLC